MIRFNLIAVLACVCATTFSAHSKETIKHLGTTQQQLKAKEWNRTHALLLAKPNFQAVRPFSEVENTGYVAISGDDDFEMPQLRLAIAKNMPAGVTMVIYVGSASDVPALKKLYSPYLGANQLKFLVVPMDSSSDPIWARDSLPFPVYTSAVSPTSTFGLVDSIYPQDFEPDAVIGKALSLPITKTGQYFRGGNLLLDLDGNCYSENVNETAGLSDADAFFKNYFGCSTVTLLDQEGGIGDLDERVKFLTGKDVLTDNDNYAKLLTSKGYTVHRIPVTGNDMETYMNTLLVNGTMFVPQMGIEADATAIKAYQDLGFKAVGVITKQLADQGDGNIHCVTMNYPPGSFQDSARGTDFVEFAH